MLPSVKTGEELNPFSSQQFNEGSIRCNHPSDYFSAGFCNLCFFRNEFTRELPGRFHAYKVLAENGNPETHPLFISHMNLMFGIRPPVPGESLISFQNWQRDNSAPAWKTFPIASILWTVMRFQPPLGHPLHLAVVGMPEAEIASQLEISRYNLSIRLGKALRMGLRMYNGYNARQEARAKLDSSIRPESERDSSEQAPCGSPGVGDNRPAKYHRTRAR